jgi:DDE superfamily endonuclease
MAARDWEEELRAWLGPFLDHLSHKARRRICPLYVAGLIGLGERKSVQPMAGTERKGYASFDPPERTETARLTFYNRVFDTRIENSEAFRF